METIYKTILTIDIAIFSSLILFYFLKSDEINPILGYRTKRSMKNKRNWIFAQNFFSKKWLLTIPLMLVSQLPILLDNTLDEVVLISLISFIVYSIYLIFITEKKLKQLDKSD